MKTRCFDARYRKITSTCRPTWRKALAKLGWLQYPADMKLADYCFTHRLSPHRLQRLLGVASNNTVHRYFTGQRIPQPHILHKIEQLTGGLVTLRDFLDTSPPKCAAFIVDAKGKRRMVFPWNIYDNRLDLAFESMLSEPVEGTVDSPAVVEAFAQLQELDGLKGRLHRRGDLFVIDGRVTDTRGLIRAANRERTRLNLPLIRYPGV